MSFGKMNGFADIVKTRQVKDSEGFIHSENEVLASVRVYREGRHGSQRWANLAAFSEATDLFRAHSLSVTQPLHRSFWTRTSSMSLSR